MTRFFNKINPAYLSYNMTAETLANCHQDWVRKSTKTGRLMVNNYDIHFLAKRYNEFATPEDLRNFWRDEIISQTINEPKLVRFKSDLLKYLEAYFHQSGCLFLLQTAIAAQLVKVNYTMNSRETLQLTKIITKNNSIRIQESVKVNSIYSLDNFDDVLSTQSKSPLISATMEQRIYLDDDGKIVHEIIKVNVNFDTAKTRDLFSLAYNRSFLELVMSHMATNKIAIIDPYTHPLKHQK